MRNRVQGIKTILFPWLATSLILLASMFIAIQFTETVQMVERTNQLPSIYWWMLPLSAALGMVFSWFFLRKRNLWRYIGYLLSTVVFIVIDLIQNTSSVQQLIWFTSVALILGSINFLITGLVLNGKPSTVRDDLKKIKKYLYLTQIWARNSILSEYSQNVLGIAWVMLTPLVYASVMAFAFEVLLGRGDVAGKPFIVFLLSGIVVFQLFSRIVLRSSISIIRAMGVIKQIYFPREVILLTLVGEIFIDFIFGFITLLIVNAFVGSPLNYYYLTLPIPTVIMLGLTMGTSFYTSYAGLVFRDLSRLISLIMQMLFYITVLFSLRIVTPNLAIFGLINPLTGIVEFFRSVILHEQVPDMATLVWPAALALVLLYSGYIFFKNNDDRLVDYL
jgi:lipopolysaccharide transport system permease protein